MADMAHDRKSNLSWLWWLLLLAGIAALIYFIVKPENEGAEQALANDDTSAAIADPDDDDLPEIAGATADGEAITDLALIATTSDGSLEGRRVELTNVRAGSVPEDAGFWLEAGDDSRVWVVLEEVRTPNTPIEGRVDVDRGDRVDVVGIMRKATDGAPAGAAIPGPTAPLPDGIAHFIYASKVTQSAP